VKADAEIIEVKHWAGPCYVWQGGRVACVSPVWLFEQGVDLSAKKFILGELQLRVIGQDPYDPWSVFVENEVERMKGDRLKTLAILLAGALGALALAVLMKALFGSMR